MTEHLSEQERWALYEARKAAWLEANPSAYPDEVSDFCARLAEELGL